MYLAFIIKNSWCVVYYNTTARVHIQIYTYMRKPQYPVMTTSINEWTHFLIKIYLTLYSRKVDICCVWEMSWRQGQTAILTPVLLATIAALLPHLSWGCSAVGLGGPKALCLPLALTLAFCLQLLRTVWAPGYIIDVRTPASPVLPLFLHRCISWLTARSRVNI